MTANILVTGGSGFIGNILVETLVENGYRVRVVCRNPRELERHKLSSAMEVVNLDLSATNDFSEVLRDISHVVHLAGRAHIQINNDSNVNQHHVLNTEVTRKLAAQAAEGGVRRFIYLSTIKVNGEYTNNEGKPGCFNEKNIPAPADEYAISKYQGECELRRISNSSRMEFVIIRPPLVYGPGVKANFLALLKLVDKYALLPFSSIMNKRSMIFVRNLSEFIVKCIELPEAGNEVFLVGDCDVSTPELVSVISRKMGRQDGLFSFPVVLLEKVAAMAGQGERIRRLTRSLVVDSSKARELLNWIPSFSFEDGISETVEWYQQSVR